LATFTVTNTYAGGTGSLRAAITAANADPDLDTIVFDDSLHGETIVLSSGGQLAITQSVIIDGDIDGDNVADITISGNNTSRILDVTGDGTQLQVRSLILTQGEAGPDENGGAIRAGEGTLLYVVDSVLTENHARRGGAIAADGVASVGHSLISFNESDSSGAGIWLASNSDTFVNSFIQNTTIYGNTTPASGGGIAADGRVNLSITSSSIAGNYVGNVGGGIRIGEDVTLLLGSTVVTDNIRANFPTSFNNIYNVYDSGTITYVSSQVGGNLGLGQLLDNGHSTLTMLPLDDSVLIDSGHLYNDAFDIDGDGNFGENLPLDGSRNPRVTGAAIDIGANERGLEVHETIRGDGRANRIVGGLGDDQLFGFGGVDALLGGADDDFLDGGAEVDNLDGGAGDDTYDLRADLDNITDVSGVDTILTTISRDLLNYFDIENLTLQGSAPIEGQGNADNNIIKGNSATNLLMGRNGNDRLDSGGGADDMRGGRDNDTYVIRSGLETIVELANEGTADRVAATVSYTLAAGAEVEEMSTTNSAGTGAINLSGNELVQEITGNAGNNRLDGKGGADTLKGLGGNDTLIVDNAGDIVIEAANGGTDRVGASVSYVLAAGQHIEKMSTTSSGGTGAINLTGNELVQEITGNAGNNRLDGGGGADTLIGLNGNDTLIVDNAADIVIEALNGGTDRVSASVSYVLAAGQHIEKMSTTQSGATGAINLTGNELVQEITGNAGNNRLDGLGGADTLIGLNGNDTFRVDNTGDVIVEALDGGTDRVSASVSYTLAAGVHVERMSTTNSAGTSTINLYGNEFVQDIVGNDGNGWLRGGGGADTLTGRGGDDTFDFDAISESGTSASTRNVITDFTDTGGQQDRINVATIDANTATGANDAFVLDTNGSFSTGEIRQTLINGGADLLLEFNNDADASADMSILLQGRTTLLNGADFLF
jgi:Ca2+-binding RTX toxin-like protein